MRRTVPLLALTAVGLVTAVGCSSYNDERGRGDAPIGVFNDGPVYVRNAPDQFMNVAFACVGVNGVYTHTREAAPVIVPDDPNCAEGGFWDELGLAEVEDQAISPQPE